MCAFAGGALFLHNLPVGRSVHISAFSGSEPQRMRCDEAMTESDAAADRSSLVPGTHRLIRVVDGREGPFAGTLVAGDEGVAVCVDAESLAGWDGWRFSDAEHICGVMDVRRRVNGHDALLPWCTQRIETFVGRRQAAEAPLTAGELGTLVVSMFRGMRELGNDAESVVGAWWLTGDGRPLFVHGDGGAARAGTAALIERIAQQSADRSTVRILEEISAALRQPRHHLEDDHRWEEQLFAVAAPRALRLDIFAPERVADIAPRRLPRIVEPVETRATRRAGRAARRESRTAQHPAGMAVTVVGAAIERGRELVMRFRREAVSSGAGAAARDGAGSQSGARKHSRRRPLLLAGSLAAVVLVTGLLWPSGDSTDDAEALVSTSPSSNAVPDTEDALAPPADSPPAAEQPPPSAAAESSLAAVPALLDAIRLCVEAAAEECPDAISEGATLPQDGAVSQGAEANTAALVDDYGDVAVIRLTPVEMDAAAPAEQMLVLERREDKWLVRDVYDVAHQPE